MSRIITSLTCEKCGKQYDRYISFGHPDKDFDWQWKCQCEHINTLHIKALPMRGWRSYETKRTNG